MVASGRAAAVDVGTNSVQVVVGQIGVGGRLEVMLDQTRNSRLGEGLDRTGRLGEDGIHRAMSAIRESVEAARGLDVNRIRLVGTSAVRTAENGPEFVNRALAELGIKIEAISEEDECRYSYLSVALDETLGRLGDDFVMVDVGGGSTEMVSGANRRVSDCVSVRLGCVRLTERFLRCDCGTCQMVDAAAYAERMLESSAVHPHGEHIVAVGGSAVNLARVWFEVPIEHTDEIHGSVLSFRNVRRLMDELFTRGVAERRKLVGLEPERADTILAGAVIYDRVMAHFSHEEMIVCARGLRHGVLYEMLGTMTARQNIEELAASYEHDVGHSRQVTRIAEQIFDVTGELHKLGAQERELLVYAALLHDIGWSVDSQKHHKHAYDLILKHPPEDLSKRNMLIVANIARYHSKALPSLSHEGFAALSSADRETVRRSPRCSGWRMGWTQAMGTLSRLPVAELRTAGPCSRLRRAGIRMSSSTQPPRNPTCLGGIRPEGSVHAGLRSPCGHFIRKPESAHRLCHSEFRAWGGVGNYKDGRSGMKIVAVIDVGTNSVRLAVAQVSQANEITTVASHKEAIRLGEGEFGHRRITRPAMERGILVLCKFADIARRSGASEIVAVATAALREAQNRLEFLERTRSECGVDVKVISGLEEARLIYLGVVSGVDLSSSKALFVDIGGGTTEMIVGDAKGYDLLESFRAGAVRIADVFLTGEKGPITRRRYRLMTDYVTGGRPRVPQGPKPGVRSGIREFGDHYQPGRDHRTAAW